MKIAWSAGGADGVSEGGPGGGEVTGAGCQVWPDGARTQGKYVQKKEAWKWLIHLG